MIVHHVYCFQTSALRSCFSSSLFVDSFLSSNTSVCLNLVNMVTFETVVVQMPLFLTVFRRFRIIAAIMMCVCKHNQHSADTLLTV